MKKIISLILSVLIVFSTVVMASALSYEGFSYRTTLSRDEIIITGYTGTEKNISVPAEIKGLPVAIINKEAFMYNKDITSVSIPSSVEEIGDNAFMYCSNLSEFDFNNANATVGNNAFYGCSVLLTLKDTGNISKINTSAFDNTAWLNNQPEGVVYIGKNLYKFKGTMSQNANITVKSGTVSISPDAFLNKTDLAKISFPTTLKNVGYRAFCGCTSLMSVTLLKHIENIESTAFGYKEVRNGTSIAYVPISGFKIITEENSAGHKYAQSGNLSFELINSQIKATSIKLNKTQIDCKVGSENILTAEILPANTTNKTVSWSSSDTSVATVSADGKVTAKANGTATITCKTTDGSNLSATCVINVTSETVKIKTLRFSKVFVKWGAGRTDTLMPEISPANVTNRKLTWESSNPDVLKVDANGKITGVSSGIVLLTCRTTDGSNKKSTCIVTVNPGTPQGIKASKVSDTSAKITWTPSVSATGYYVYRATSEDGSYKKVGTVKEANFTDQNLKAGTTYYYKVVSYDFGIIFLFKSTKSAATKITM